MSHLSLRLLFCTPPSPCRCLPLGCCLSLSGIYTHRTCPLSLNVFARLRLVSIREDRARGWGPWAPTPTPGGNIQRLPDQEGHLSWDPMVTSESAFLFLFSCLIHWDMPRTCSLWLYMQTNIKRWKYVLHCLSLFMLPASNGNVTSLPLSLFTVVHFWEKTTSARTHTHTHIYMRTDTARSMVDHPVYVFMCPGWVTFCDLFLIAGVDTCISFVAPFLLFKRKAEPGDISTDNKHYAFCLLSGLSGMCGFLRKLQNDFFFVQSPESFSDASY